MEDKYQPLLNSSSQEQIKRRIRELDSALNEDLIEFPHIFSNEFGESSLDFIKYPNIHIISELEGKVKNVYIEAQNSSKHCE